ncbi:MAG TPA: nuclear transport factor 2 family protein [Myxococcales bacterium]|nr:nuclear transport factor 2 family protein [Myxococcales bacterium]
MSTQDTLARWHAQMEAGERRDWDAVMAHFDPDCEWWLVTSGKRFRGALEIRLFLESGLGAADRDKPEIRGEFASGDWGLFEYTSRGIINKGVNRFSAVTNPKAVRRSPSATDVSRVVRSLVMGFVMRLARIFLIGRRFEIPVCFIYHLNERGLIDRVNEYVGKKSFARGGQSTP